MPFMQSFFGGSDTQRSTNLADNRLINLYPTTNDKGDVTAFVSTPGLAQYSSSPDSVPVSDMYVASNGRWFYTTGASLYEEDAAGTKTLRGTITSSLHYEMSDNGNELILVNGVNGYIFTFVTNVLEQINVFSSTATITIATPAVVTTSSAHGLVAGQRVIFGNNGDVLPTGLDFTVLYYVIAAGLGTTTMQLSLTSGGAAIATSGVQSGVHTLDSDGWGFPNGATTVSYLNGRFVCIEIGTQNFYCSEVLDGKYWDALNVQTADSNPDKAEVSFVSHNELIVFCEYSGEVFNDSGTIPSPFTRNVSGVFEVGCNAPFSVAKIDNSVMWLGQSSTGGNIIYRLNGYTPTRISTYSIEYALGQMTTTTDAQAFAYQQGHHFYVITFPTGNRTFVYDANTQLWHERAAWDSTTATFNKWNANHYAFFNGKHLVCDYSTHAINELDLSIYDDNGNTRKWLRSWRCSPSDMKRQIHHKLTLDAEMGVANDNSTAVGEPPVVMLRYSRDGGHTWSSELWKTLGEIGEYTKRVFWHRLGMTTGQPRIYEISGTAPVKITLLGVYLE